MTGHIFVVAAGDPVPDLDAGDGTMIGREGRFVAPTIYIHRRLRSGELRQATPPAPAKSRNRQTTEE